MPEYIFYAIEGTTLDPKGNETHNCQVVGCGSGMTEEEALNNLLGEDPSIMGQGFNPRLIVGRELAPQRLPEFEYKNKNK